MSQEDRLGRIEDKLDRMSEAITTLARMEERMVSLFKRMDSYDENMVKLSNRVITLEKHVGLNGMWIRFVERVFWISCTAIITGIVAYLLQK